VQFHPYTIKITFNLVHSEDHVEAAWRGSSTWWLKGSSCGRWHRYPELLVGILLKGLDIGLKKTLFLLVSCRDSGLEATDRQFLKIL